MTNVQTLRGLKSWPALNEVLREVTADQCAALLMLEMSPQHGPVRPQYAIRIHRRLCKLRAMNERKVLLAVLDGALPIEETPFHLVIPTEEAIAADGGTDEQ